MRNHKLIAKIKKRIILINTITTMKDKKYTKTTANNAKN